MFVYLGSRSPVLAHNVYAHTHTYNRGRVVVVDNLGCSGTVQHILSVLEYTGWLLIINTDEYTKAIRDTIK